MQRFFFLIILFVFALKEGNAQEKLTATASIMQDMVQNICEGVFEVDVIVPIGGDPHIYDPTPSDALKISESDMIFKNGLTFEGWLEKLIKNSGSQAQEVLMTKGIPAIKSLVYENSADPHAWMDVLHAKKYVQNAYEALCKRYPQHVEAFTKNHDRYQKELDDLHQWITEEIKKIDPQKRVLVTSHDAFQYFGRRYGLELFSLLGTTTDAEIQTSDIIRVNKIIKEKNLPAIFIESTINPKVMKQLATDNGIAIGGELFADSLGDPESGASSYIAMLRHNTKTLVEGLTMERREETKDQKSSTHLLLYVGLGLLALFLLGFYLIRRR